MEDDFLAELESLFAAGSAEELPEINVLGGFVGPPQPRRVDFPGGPNSDGSVEFQPYYEGSEVESLTRMNEEQFARFQEALVANGIVREVIPGMRLDAATVKGMQTLMAIGNSQRTEWQGVLDGVIRAGGLTSGKTAEQFEPRPFLKPDYATLAQDVKATFRQRLGRDPDDYELQQLTGELTGYYALENEAANEFASIQHEQATTPGVQPGGEVGNVDPMARFAQLFDEKYKGEMAFNDDKEDAKVSRAVTEGATSTLDGMINRSR